MGEMKEGNFLFIPYSNMYHASPPFPFYYLTNERNELLFAVDQPRQIGEMEEMEEIGECYGGSFYSTNTFNRHLPCIPSCIPPPFSFYYLANERNVHSDSTKTNGREDGCRC